MKLYFKTWLLQEAGGLIGNPGTVPNEPTPTSACPACVSFNLRPPPTPTSSAPANLAKSYPGNSGQSGGPGPRSAGGAATVATPTATVAAPAATTKGASGIPATTPIK